MARGEAKDEGIHVRLEVPRSEATWRREPGVNTFILGALALLRKRTSSSRTAGLWGGAAPKVFSNNHQISEATTGSGFP